ncbi:hypothetical protein Plhal304r1_c023g0080001 [Plasmopara halstedii]
MKRLSKSGNRSTGACCRASFNALKARCCASCHTHGASFLFRLLKGNASAAKLFMKRR